MKLTNDKYKELISLAKLTRGRSYSPYSHFAVGAALIAADGRIYTGTNVENSSYGATVCAERSAFFTAVSEGVHDFVAIAVVGGPDSVEDCPTCQPCALCLQVMAEFCEPDFEIILEDGEGGYTVHRFDSLLAKPFHL